jgi:hypothetical protein
MSDEPFILLDRASRNILGEFQTLDDARVDLLEWVRSAPEAAESLEIWHGDVHVVIDDADAAHTSPAA